MKRNSLPDMVLMVTVLLLLGFGIVMILSASGDVANHIRKDGNYFLNRQLIWVVVGLFAMLGTMYFDINLLRKNRNISYLLMGTVGVMLILVLIPGLGYGPNGVQRWLQPGFQPSELCKLVMVLFLAYFVEERQNQLDDFKNGYLPAITVVAVCAILIAKEPDLGTAVMLFIIAMVMFFAAGYPLNFLSSTVVTGCMGTAVMVYLNPYMWDRILTFITNKADPLGKGYHRTQSLYAFASGGLWGVGLGESRQKLFYLPEAHTDFIYAIIGEEFGFIGTTMVLFLFFIIVLRGIKIANRSHNVFQMLVAIGIVAMIGCSALINTAVVLDLLPITGLTLPFLSYGGSSLVVNLAAVGILLNISRKQA